jgi:hypothetical protein
MGDVWRYDGTTNDAGFFNGGTGAAVRDPAWSLDDRGQAWVGESF